ncbi:hypothetical protein [Streptomyces sp. NPDC004376]
MSKPLPAHGTYARANGCPGYRPPCNCEPCVIERRRVRKRRKVNAQLGRPAIVDAAPARQHLTRLRATMTWDQIHTAAGRESGNLRAIFNGTRQRILTTTHNRVLAIRPQAPASGKYVDAAGTRRRLQALRAIGWSSHVIAARSGLHETRIQTICTSLQPTVRQSIATKVQKVFAELHATPAPAGRSATRTRGFAAEQRWAPPAAWDDIDNPAAAPDWTGYCGTDRGYWVHNWERQPACPRCEHAYTVWLAERAHLTPRELSRERFHVRATAGRREADLAHDARELARVSGLNTEQAAERLGVTRQHLQQVMNRHPEETAA